MLGELETQRRAVRMRIGGEERWIASEDAGLYRDALGAVPPGGLPDAFLEDVEEPLARLARRYARTHGPVHHRASRSGRYGVDMGPVLRELEQGGRLIRGELRPGRQRARVVRRRRAAPPAARVARLAAPRGGARRAARAGAACCRPGRAWTRRPPGGAGVDRLRELLVPLQGLALAPEVWERDVLPRRVGQLLARLARPALRGRRARLGRRRLARAAARAGWRSTSATTRAGSARRTFKGDPPSEPLHDRPSASAWSAAPRSGPTCSPTSARPSPSSCRRRSGTSSGRARSRTTRSLRCARRGSRWPARERDGGRRFARRRRPGRRRCRAAGRSPRRCSPTRRRTGRGCARWPRCCSSATGS